MAYCALYCGDCYGHTGRVADLARDLRKELRQTRYDLFAKWMARWLNSTVKEALKEAVKKAASTWLWGVLNSFAGLGQKSWQSWLGR